MSEDMPMEIWACKVWGVKLLAFDEETTVENARKYHHDDKYRVALKSAKLHIKLYSDLKAEVEKLREENERLKTAIAEAKIVQYAVEG